MYSIFFFLFFLSVTICGSVLVVDQVETKQIRHVNFQEVKSSKILFFDMSQVDLVTTGISFEMHPGKHANEGKPVIHPTEEWENWATFAYNTVLQHPNGTFFMY